jgi:hypothetical protein
MTIFGGAYGIALEPIYLNDVWVLSNANGLGGTPSWTQLSPQPDPTQTTNGYGGLPIPGGGNAVYDATNNRMTLFGNRSTGTTLNEIWVLRNANGLGESAWMQLFPNPDPTYGFPSSRAATTAVYDANNNRMIIYGGIGYSDVNLNDVWVLSDADVVPVNDWMLYATESDDFHSISK